MIEIPQMCNKCQRALLKLAAKDGGVIFCSHRSNSPKSGVFVAAVPIQQGRCKLQIIYPCTESAAREKAEQILRERMQATSRWCRLRVDTAGKTVPAREADNDSANLVRTAGFSLHAGVAAKAHQRRKLERRGVRLKRLLAVSDVGYHPYPFETGLTHGMLLFIVPWSEPHPGVQGAPATGIQGGVQVLRNDPEVLPWKPWANRIWRTVLVLNTRGKHMPATPRMTMMNNPFLVWMNLGWKTAEMTSASAQVYNHRMSRMVNSGSFPSAADQREFSRMGQEKIEAGMESLQAMMDHATSMNYSLWQQYVSQLMAVGTAMLSLATSRTITQSLARQQELTRAVMASSRTGARLSDSAAKLTSRGLRPVHSRASANARRLKL